MQDVITLNHKGARGIVLSKKYYNIMRDFIVATFESRSEISFEYLMLKAEKFNTIYPIDSFLWYLLKVKQDMEGKGILKVRFIGSTPRIQMLKINRRALKDWFALQEYSSL
mgnify:CR=1 FL=1